MIELTTGVKTNKDLAEWMGVTEGSFRVGKKNNLEKLKYFAEYHLNGAGKVVIDKVLEPVYDKTKASSASIIMQEVPKKWNSNGLDTASNVGRKIQKEFQEKDPNSKIANLAPATVNNYAGMGRTYYFGSPILQTSGTLGHAQFQWAKKIYRDDDSGIAEIEPLTEEELKIKDALVKKYYGNTQDQVLFIIESINSGLATGREMGEALEKVAKEHKKKDSYRRMINELNDILGCTVIKATRVFLEADEKGFPGTKMIEMEEEE